MELIEIRGYGSKEKLAIAKYSMLPKMLQEFGLNTEQVSQFYWNFFWAIDDL